MVDMFEYDLSQIKTDISICPRYEKAFEILGKRWNALIIDVLAQKDCRFSELSRSIEKLSDRVLSNRLQELEATGIVAKQVENEKTGKILYTLTEKGKNLALATQALKKWAEEWVSVDN